VRERERVCAAPWISEPSYHTGEHSHSVLIFRPKHGKNDGPVALFIRIWAICSLREKLVTKDLSSHRLVGSRLFLFSCPWWFSCVSQFCCAYIHDFCFVNYLNIIKINVQPYTHAPRYALTHTIHPPAPRTLKTKASRSKVIASVGTGNVHARWIVDLCTISVTFVRKLRLRGLWMEICREREDKERVREGRERERVDTITHTQGRYSQRDTSQHTAMATKESTKQRSVQR